MDTLMNTFSNNKIVKELQELSKKVFEEKEEFGPDGLSLLKRVLETVNIEDMRIKNFSKSDSNIISTLIFKQNTLNFVKYAVENRETVTNDLLDSVIDVLYDIKDCSKNLAVILEKQRLEREIFYLVVDICYLTKYTNEKLQLSVREKTMPDELSVNFALLSTGPFKSYELSVLNELKINNVLVNFLTGYKNKLRKIVKETIIDEVCKKITTNNLESVYSIFFILNERTKKEFFEIEEKQCDEYIAFMSSLIGDLDSAEYVYEKLSSSFDRMEEALKQFIFYSKEKTLKMSTRDEALIFYILNTVEKISAYKTSGFYKFLGVFQDVLPLNISIRNKAKIYEILVHFINDKDVFIKKNVDCKDEVMEEIKKNEFLLLPKLISFINEHEKRRDYEENLVSAGKSIGSPYLSLEEGCDNYKVLGLKSEDPETIIECFEGKLPLDIIKLNLVHIRNAILKNENLVDRIVQYQIKNKVVILDVLLINLIQSSVSTHFFGYISLFKDFSTYINSDFLDRLSDSIHEGLGWMINNYNKKLGKFIINNCNWFNDLIKKLTYLQPKLLKLYGKVIDDFIGELKITAVDFKDENLNVEVDVLYVSDKEEFTNNDFFTIFSKQLVYHHFYSGETVIEKDLLSFYKKEGYVEYVKAKIVVGCNVSADIGFLQQNLINVEGLIGFYNVVGNTPIECQGGKNILGNFGKKNTEFFIKQFYEATQFERFLLFFGIKEMNATVETIIKEETYACLKESNKLYLDMCVVNLFRCNNLDHLLSALEKVYENSQLLVSLSLLNLSRGGKYFSNNLYNMLSKNQANKALFFLYFNNVWDKERVYELVSKMDYTTNNELKMIVDNYNRFN